MCKISIGNLRYLYGFNLKIAYKIAHDLKAEVNKDIFQSYCGNELNDKCVHIFINNIAKDAKKYPLPSFHGPLSTWFDNSEELDFFISEAYKDSGDRNYPHIFPKINPMRSRLYDLQSNPEEYIRNLIYCCILDTSFVDLYKLIYFVKTNGYTHPTRQHFESHRNLNINWETFKNALDICHATPLAQGGSRPETDKIKETKATCEVILNHLIDNDICFMTSEKEFLEQVKISMESAAKGSLYQISSARSFFRHDERLKGHKPGRGRPRKNQ